MGFTLTHIVTHVLIVLFGLALILAFLLIYAPKLIPSSIYSHLFSNSFYLTDLHAHEQELYKAWFTSECKQNAKTKWKFDVDVLPMQIKQHSAVRRMFGKQANAICKLSVLQREFEYDIFRCRVYLLPQQMPNSVQMYHTFCLALLPHASFTFIFRFKCTLNILYANYFWSTDSL